MEGLLKTYAKRLARKHVLQNLGPDGRQVLETEEQLLEMALSRLREELFSKGDRPDDGKVAALVRREAAFLVGRYTEDDTVRDAARVSVESLADDEIIPRVH
jgi:hypothetical protein